MLRAVRAFAYLLMCIAVGGQYASGDATLSIVDKSSAGLLRVVCQREDSAGFTYEQGHHVHYNDDKEVAAIRFSSTADGPKWTTRSVAEAVARASSTLAR